MAGKQPVTKIVRPLRGGQITIPAEFRKRLAIEDDSMLQITLIDGELRIRPIKLAPQPSGSPWLRQLYDQLAAVREEAGGYSEQEIDEAIDQAVAAVRHTDD